MTSLGVVEDRGLLFASRSICGQSLLADGRSLPRLCRGWCGVRGLIAAAKHGFGVYATHPPCVLECAVSPLYGLVAVAPCMAARPLHSVPMHSITESRQLQAAPWPLLVRAVGLKLARMLFLLCR